MTNVYLLVLSLILVPNAYAYIDPGTGTLVLQMALAALAGCLFYIRNIYRWVMRFLRPEKPVPEPERKPTSDAGRAEP